jgi:hypothetical protein
MLRAAGFSVLFFARRCYRAENPTRRGTEAGARTPRAKQAEAHSQASTKSAQGTGKDGTGQDLTKRGQGAPEQAGKQASKRTGKQASKHSCQRGLAKKERGPQDTYKGLSEPTGHNLPNYNHPRKQAEPPTTPHRTHTARHRARTSTPIPNQAAHRERQLGRKPAALGGGTPDRQHTPGRGARMHWQLTADRLKGHRARHKRQGAQGRGRRAKQEGEEGACKGRPGHADRETPSKHRRPNPNPTTRHLRS